MLKTILLRKKLTDRQKAAEELEQRSAAFKKREEELAQAIEEAETEEEVSAVEEAVAELETSQADVKAQLEKIRDEINDLLAALLEVALVVQLLHLLYCQVDVDNIGQLEE